VQLATRGIGLAFRCKAALQFQSFSSFSLIFSKSAQLLGPKGFTYGGIDPSYNLH